MPGARVLGCRLLHLPWALEPQGCKVPVAQVSDFTQRIFFTIPTSCYKESKSVCESHRAPDTLRAPSLF